MLAAAKFGILVLQKAGCKPLASCGGGARQYHPRMPGCPIQPIVTCLIPEFLEAAGLPAGGWPRACDCPDMNPPGGIVRLRNVDARRRAIRGPGEDSGAPLPRLPAPEDPKHVIGRWRITRRINQGARLSIYRARPLTDSMGPGCYALKTVADDRRDNVIACALLRREAAVAASVSHPHVVSILSAHLAGKQPHVVLPYLEGITLSRRLHSGIVNRATLSSPNVPVSMALWIVRQMASALASLHDAGWLHGQVCPEHVVISPQGHATLIDLTQARRLASGECELDGTLPVAARYAAPETCAARGRITAASDTYALGIVLFETMAGRPPFDAPDPRRLAASHRRDAPPDVRHFRPDASRETSALVRWMLAKEPLRRPNDNELLRWLAELEIEELSGAGF
jgi:serine/threonine protein kinase